MLSCCFERAVSTYLAYLAFYFECLHSYGDAGVLLCTFKVNLRISGTFLYYCTLKIGLYWTYLDLVCSGIIWTCLCLQILAVWYWLVTTGLSSKFCSMGFQFRRQPGRDSGGHSKSLRRVSFFERPRWTYAAFHGWLTHSAWCSCRRELGNFLLFWTWMPQKVTLLHWRALDLLIFLIEWNQVI